MIRLVMKNYYMTLTEKRQKISSLSSGKIDKYEYLIGKKILIKIILFFLLSEAKYMEKDSKYYLLNKCFKDC